MATIYVCYELFIAFTCPDICLKRLTSSGAVQEVKDTTWNKFRSIHIFFNQICNQIATELANSWSFKMIQLKGFVNDSTTSLNVISQVLDKEMHGARWYRNLFVHFRSVFKLRHASLEWDDFSVKNKVGINNYVNIFSAFNTKP